MERLNGDEEPRCLPSPAGLTRGSIIFGRRFYEGDGWPGQARPWRGVSVARSRPANWHVTRGLDPGVDPAIPIRGAHCPP